MQKAKAKKFRFCSRECQHKSQRKKIQRACAVCGEMYDVVFAKAEQSKFCSPQCYWRHQTTLRGVSSRKWSRVEKACERCGAAFTIKKTKATNARYCSKSCYDAAHANQVEKVCEHCGKCFSIQGSMADETRFCCRRCYHLYRGETSIERKVAAALRALGIEFVREYRIGRYSIDFFVPASNIAIEADGDYWHNASHDQKRDAYVLSKGVHTVRITESELNAADPVDVVYLRIVAYTLSAEANVRKQRQRG
jgi:very-short-patch-repair endonuclease